MNKLSNVTLNDAILILKDSYPFFHTGNWHLDDESKDLNEPCKRLYCKTKSYQFYFFDNKIDIDIMSDDICLDKINFDVKYICYIKALQLKYYVPSLFELVHRESYDGNQSLKMDLKVFDREILFSKFKGNVQELYMINPYFHTSIDTIIYTQNLPESFTIYDAFSTTCENLFKPIPNEKILLPDIYGILKDKILKEKSEKNNNIFFKDVTYVIFNGTSHYIADCDEVQELYDSKQIFEVVYHNEDIDICQNMVDKLNQKV